MLYEGNHYHTICCRDYHDHLCYKDSHDQIMCCKDNDHTIMCKDSDEHILFFMRTRYFGLAPNILSFLKFPPF